MFIFDNVNRFRYDTKIKSITTIEKVFSQSFTFPSMYFSFYEYEITFVKIIFNDFSQFLASLLGLFDLYLVILGFFISYYMDYSYRKYLLIHFLRNKEFVKKLLNKLKITDSDTLIENQKNFILDNIILEYNFVKYLVFTLFGEWKIVELFAIIDQELKNLISVEPYIFDFDSNYNEIKNSYSSLTKSAKEFTHTEVLRLK